MLSGEVGLREAEAMADSVRRMGLATRTVRVVLPGSANWSAGSFGLVVTRRSWKEGAVVGFTTSELMLVASWSASAMSLAISGPGLPVPTVRPKLDCGT